MVDKVEGIDIGETIELDKVLLVGSKDKTHVGRPFVPTARVIMSLEESLKDAKVIIFKKRRRKHSQSTHGHRRQISVLRIESIEFDGN